MHMHAHAKMHTLCRGRDRDYVQEKRKSRSQEKARTALPKMHISVIAQRLISNQEPDASVCAVLPILTDAHSVRTRRPRSREAERPSWKTLERICNLHKTCRC